MKEYRLTEKIEEEIYMGRDKAGISIKNRLSFWRDFDFLKKKIAVTQFGFLKKQSLAMFCKHEKSEF